MWTHLHLFAQRHGFAGLCSAAKLLNQAGTASPSWVFSKKDRAAVLSLESQARCSDYFPAALWNFLHPFMMRFFNTFNVLYQAALWNEAVTLEDDFTHCCIENSWTIKVSCAPIRFALGFHFFAPPARCSTLDRHTGPSVIHSHVVRAQELWDRDALRSRVLQCRKGHRPKCGESKVFLPRTVVFVFANRKGMTRLTMDEDTWGPCFERGAQLPWDSILGPRPTSTCLFRLENHYSNNRQTYDNTVHFIPTWYSFGTVRH